MEAGEDEASVLFGKIIPPRIEDAGLEDCALPPESIREAFLKAASAARSRAASVFSVSDGVSEDDWVNDPPPDLPKSKDALVGIWPSDDTPGACAAKKGGGMPEVTGDKVVDGARDDDVERKDDIVEADVPERGRACVDGLQGLGVGEKGRGEHKGKEEKNEIGEEDSDENELERVSFEQFE